MPPAAILSPVARISFVRPAPFANAPEQSPSATRKAPTPVDIFQSRRTDDAGFQRRIFPSDRSGRFEIHGPGLSRASWQRGG